MSPSKTARCLSTPKVPQYSWFTDDLLLLNCKHFPARVRAFSWFIVLRLGRETYFDMPLSTQGYSRVPGDTHRELTKYLGGKGGSGSHKID